MSKYVYFHPVNSTSPKYGLYGVPIKVHEESNTSYTVGIDVNGKTSFMPINKSYLKEHSMTEIDIQLLEVGPNVMSYTIEDSVMNTIMSHIDKIIYESSYTK